MGERRSRCTPRKENAVLNVRVRKTDLQSDNLTREEENNIFQSSYREILGCKRTVVHGHGYMAKYPTRAELMDAQIEQARVTAAAQGQNKKLEGEVQLLREQLANEAAERDKKVEEATRRIQEEEQIKRDELRQQLIEDMASLLAQQRQPSSQSTNLPSNFEVDDAATRPTLGLENGSNGNSQTMQKSLHNNNQSGQNFITSHQLSRAARTRVTRSRSEQTRISSWLLKIKYGKDRSKFLWNKTTVSIKRSLRSTCRGSWTSTSTR